MSTIMIKNTSLMNQTYFNSSLNPNLLYLHYINQKNNQNPTSSINIPLNSYNYFQNMPYNNPNQYALTKQRNLFTSNFNPYSQINPKFFQRNDFISKNNYYPKKKNKNKKHVFNKYEKEVIRENQEKNNFDEKTPRKNCIINYLTNPIQINPEINKENISQKETLIIKNNTEEKKEEEDSYEISEENIPCNRRFSQRSKRSNDSYESNCSNSTSDTVNELQKEKIIKDLKDVSDSGEKNITKKEVKNEYKLNPEFENTEILNVKVKLGENKFAIFKLKRFDDIFVTIQYFCEINNLDEKMIKPLIIKSLCAINTIYQVMNSTIDEKNLKILEEINKNK